MLLTIHVYHIQLTLNYANGACEVCGRYHMTDGRYHEDCGSIVYIVLATILPPATK